MAPEDEDKADVPEMTVAELKQHVDQRFAAFEERFDRRLVEEHAATRRLFDVVAERLKVDLNLFAEGYQADHDRIDDHGRIRKLENRRR